MLHGSLYLNKMNLLQTITYFLYITKTVHYKLFQKYFHKLKQVRNKFINITKNRILNKH